MSQSQGRRPTNRHLGAIPAAGSVPLLTLAASAIWPWQAAYAISVAAMLLTAAYQIIYQWLEHERQTQREQNRHNQMCRLLESHVTAIGLNSLK